jgi:hypothetical protein
MGIVHAGYVFNGMAFNASAYAIVAERLARAQVSG